MCYDNTPCGAGRQCIDPGKYNAKCDPCPSGTQCTCPSGQVADGSGGCGVNSCDGYLTANGYGAAKDMASFKAALGSGVSEIGITASFTVNEDVNLYGKKIYPASKYTGSPKCSSTPKPTLEITGHVALNNALIDGVNLNITGGSYKDYLVSGNGTLKDMDLATSYYAFMFNGNTVNLQGTINLSGSGINLDNGSSLNIAGTLSIAGSENSATIKLENSSKMTVASSGKFSYTGRAGTMGVVEAKTGSKAIFNGPLVIKPVTGTNYQPGVWSGLSGYSGGSFELNANGNVIESYHSAIYMSSSDTYTTSLKINGSTTLSMKNTGSTNGQHAIEAWGGNYGNKSKFTIDINAPLTVTGLYGYSGEYEISQADHLFYILDTTINVNSTVTTNTGIAKLLRNNLNMKAGGSIMGLSKYSNEGSGTTTYTSGTKLKIGGVCKKATKTESKVGSSQKYYTINVTSSNSLGSPFTGGC